MDAKNNTPKPTITQQRTLLQTVRAGFLMQGTTLHQYLQSLGIHDTRNVYRTLHGNRKGPAARALKKQILDAAGVHDLCEQNDMPPVRFQPHESKEEHHE